MINRIKIPGCLRIDLPSNGTTMQNSLGKFDFKRAAYEKKKIM
jgi:hypothetical protein